MEGGKLREVWRGEEGRVGKLKSESGDGVLLALLAAGYGGAYTMWLGTVTLNSMSMEQGFFH